jgi:hypothetical protein
LLTALPLLTTMLTTVPAGSSLPVAAGLVETTDPALMGDV